MENHRTDPSHQQIVPYDPKWVALYETEAAKLRGLFGEQFLGVEHIGSTSITGLPSKPIIDIMVLIKNHEQVDMLIPKLKEIGYPFDTSAHTDNSTERHLFRKGNPTQYHLSIAYLDRGSFWKRQLAFRDYLRTHSEDRERYAALKHELIKKDPTGKGTYISGKTDLVNEILDKAGFVRWKLPLEIKATIISKTTGKPYEAVYCDIESEKDFAGKKIFSVRAYCFYQDKLVIVHEAKGHWNLPGGGIEDGEDIRVGIRREVKEETNMKMGKMRFVGLQKTIDSEGIKYHTRVVCLVEPDGVFKNDPAGEVTEIKLIDPAECVKMADSNWGAIGERMLQRALEMKKQMQAEIDFSK